MQSVYDKFNEFQQQSQSERDMVRVEQLNKQIRRLGQLKLKYEFDTTSKQRKDLEHFIKVYKLAVKQIQRMKMQFTKPSLVKERLTEIFNKEKQQISIDRVMENNSDIRSSEIQIPTFKNNKFKENVIDEPNYNDDLGSPGLRNFFQKKQAQLMNRGVSPNFKSVIQPPSNKSFNKSNSRSISRQQPSSVSRSSASSFMKKNTKQLQLKKILQENKKIKEQYEKRLKRQLQLNDFEKNLLKEQKNRYMQKIEQMQVELQSLYRANYKLKQEVEIKQKQLQSKASSFNDSQSSFRNVDEGIRPNTEQPHDYQPYVMRTKHNDLKRLSMKLHEDFDVQSNHSNHSSKNVIIKPINTQQNFTNNGLNQNNKLSDEPSIDILGNQLQKELKELQKQRSKSNNTSHVSSKKWSRQYNPDKYQQNNLQKEQQKEEFFRVLRQDDEQEVNQQNNLMTNFSNKQTQNPFQKKQNASLRQFQGHSINILEPQQEFHPPPSQSAPYQSTPYQSSKNNYYSRNRPQQQSIEYRPAPNYSFTRNQNRDYSIQSNLTNYDTFDMTRTYLNMTQNQQQSLTNKYIDSRTSTRNKVAFFKDSLILIKNQTFQLAFKRSALVQTKDRVRMIFFIKNKTNSPLSVNFKYQYDAGYFKLKVNEKLQSVAPNSQAREDLQVYAYSTIDLNQVIDILLQVNYEKYGLWMPILWIELSDNENFNMPSKNQEISIIPDRQFKSYDTAKTIIPLIFGGMDSTSQWAYLYGKSKFGPCYIKLIWEMNELRIQTNAKCIDLLAFIMHHVK